MAKRVMETMLETMWDHSTLAMLLVTWMVILMVWVLVMMLGIQ
jgi:hypothetical protein